MQTFASLMDFSQSSQSIWLFRGHVFGFLTVDFSVVESSAPRPTPNLEDQFTIFISPGNWVAQLHPQAPSTHFSRLLRHAWATVRLFFSPVTTRGKIKIYKTVILPVVLYGCETWSLALGEEHRLRVFENRVLRRIFGPKREKDGSWKKLHNV
jgi:hypothetical protein